MKSLKEDVLMSRLLQLSLIGSLLIIGLLLLLQEYEVPDFILSEGMEELPVVDEADSLEKSTSPLWLRHSADWIDAHFLEPVRKWK